MCVWLRCCGFGVILVCGWDLMGLYFVGLWFLLGVGVYRVCVFLFFVLLVSCVFFVGFLMWVR